jgi:hypothetical protein
MSRLQEKYQNELAGEIQKKLGLKNPMEVPDRWPEASGNHSSKISCGVQDS